MPSLFHGIFWKLFNIDPTDSIIFRIDRTVDLTNAITYDDINFELCCVMFNIGVIHSIIAINETRSDADVGFFYYFIKIIYLHLEYQKSIYEFPISFLAAATFTG
jgi:hypothetical protein